MSTDETMPPGGTPNAMLIPAQRILLVRGRRTALRIALPPFTEVTVGSSLDNDVVIDEPGVAARHLVLRLEPGIRIEVVDDDTSLLRTTPKGAWVEQPLDAGQSVDGGLEEHLRVGSVEIEIREQPTAEIDRASDGSPLGPSTRVSDPEMIALVGLAEQLAGSSNDVLILGETGTGKDLFAELIHRRSERGQRPLVRVSCGELDDEFMRRGYASHAGATVLLDEVGGLSQSAQLGLSQLLERADRRDVAFIATSNHDLKAEVKEGRFRKDLYFRLAKVSLAIPPLRDRPGEIFPLVELFLELAGQKKTLTEGAKSALLRYSWPGNVRELRHVVERAALLAGKDRLDVDHLPPELFEESAPTRETSLPTSSGEASASGLTLREEMAQLEKRRILEALDKYPTQLEAAKALDIPIRTFVNRLDALGIPRGKKRD